MKPFRLPDAVCMGSVRLRVSDLTRSLAFYEGTLGFREGKRDGPSSFLSATGEPPYPIVLSESPLAVPKPRGTTGLYHVALRLPDRKGLARAVARLLSRRCPMQGFADHRVSEAVYLADPDGNGLELYADRPRKQWDVKKGHVAMTAEPLDVTNLLLEGGQGRADDRIAPGTTFGHVHLAVSDLPRAERFYSEILGLAVTQRSYPGALFLSAGGYHHHLGLNVWAGIGAPAPPPEAAGLMSFSILIPDGGTLNAVRTRLTGREFPVDAVPGDPSAFATRDPDGIAVVLSAAPS